MRWYLHNVHACYACLQKHLGGEKKKRRKRVNKLLAKQESKHACFSEGSKEETRYRRLCKAITGM